MRFDIEQPDLVAWHGSELRLLLGTRRGVLEWEPHEVREVSASAGWNTLGYWGERVALADEEGGIELLGAAPLRPGLGRIDALALGPELGLVGDRFGALRADGSLRYVFESAAMPVEAWWCGDRWLVRDEEGAVVLSAEGELLERRVLPAAARVWWGAGPQVASLEVEDPFLRSFTLGPNGAVAAEGRDHVVWLTDGDGLRAIEGHPRTITAMAFDPRGVVVTGCRDKVVRRLRGGTFEPVDLPPITAEGLFFSADGAWLCAAGRGEAYVLPWPG